MAQELIDKWLIKAENDLQTAENLLNMDNVIADTLCFHCQQAAEKYLKAYLVYKGVEPEKTHKIERLIEACFKYDPSFIDLKGSVVLTEYAVEFRCPDDFYIPDFNEAKSAYDIAVKVKSFVLSRIKK